jgi:hypothetical protein
MDGGGTSHIEKPKKKKYKRVRWSENSGKSTSIGPKGLRKIIGLEVKYLI